MLLFFRNSLIFFLLFLFSNLLLSCKSDKTLHTPKIWKSYSYRISLLMTGETYLLRNKSWRFYKFRNHQVPDSTVMFAYYIHRKDRSGTSIFNPPTSSAIDTIEVAINSAQADSLFILTQNYFHSFRISNIENNKVIYSHTDDASGEVQITWQGQTLTGNINALHTSNVTQQSAAFYKVENYFSKIFSTARLKETKK